MRTLGISLLILLFSSTAWADTREDYARQIVDGMKIDELYEGQYATWDNYEWQIVRMQLQNHTRRKTDKQRQQKDWLKLANSVPQHDKYFATQLKDALYTSLLKDFSDQELAELAGRVKEPSTQKLVAVLTNLRIRSMDSEAKAIVDRVTGAVKPTPVQCATDPLLYNCPRQSSLPQKERANDRK